MPKRAPTSLSISPSLSDAPSLAGLLVASILISIGTFWAFTRGANDFSVFYVAWRLVLEGRGAEIYRVTPDRFLYAPGFAWLLSPLALLPRSAALALWCFAKAAVIGGLIRAFSARARVAGGLAALSVAMLARPVLIDFQYGQVNLLILGACAWALLRHCDSRPALRPGGDALAWGALGLAAVAKLFPLPLLFVPFFGGGGVAPARRRAWARRGAVAGVALTLLVPVMTQGFGPTVGLMSDWRLALLDRGLPLESHNQSFSAFLHHCCSGMPTEIIAEARRTIELGYPLFSERAIDLLSLAWASSVLGVILAWIFRGPGPGGGARWVAFLLGAVILPSHLVWKPYFVMGLPLAVLLLREWRARWAWIAVLFALENLSGFDFIGLHLAAGFEAACILLWVHLGLYCALARTSSGAMMLESSPYADPSDA